MSQIRSKDTSPEKRVRNLLHKLGFRFRIHRKDLPGKPDIVLPKYNKIIFIHGCFWHKHNGCKESRYPQTNNAFWKNKLDGNVSRDQKNINDLKELGWDVHIIWECETKNAEQLISKINDIFRK